MDLLHLPLPPLAVTYIAQAILYIWGALVTSMPIWAPTAAYYAAVAVVIGGSLVYANAQAKRMQGRLNAMKGALDSSRSMMVRDPIVVRQTVYGQDKISGPIAYWETIGSGVTEEYHHFIVILNCDREIESIDNVWFGDEIVPLDGDGNATGRYAGYLTFKKHLGSPDQTADLDLVAASAGQWTTAHRLRGIPYLYVKMKWDATIFPNGLLNIAAEIHGVKVYDPRTDTTAWSDNAALCTADALNHFTGSPYSEIDSDELTAAANVSDEDVLLADGVSYRKKYTINGPVGSDSSPEDILTQLSSAMAGTVIYSGGKWYVQAGVYRTPSVSFDENDIVGPITISPRLSKRDTCNRVRGTRMAPDQDYQPVDVIPYKNSTYLAEDNGEEIWHDLALAYTNSEPAAQALFKIDLERTRQGTVVVTEFNLKGMKCRAGDVVNLSFARMGWTDKPFEVVEWGLKPSEDAENPIWTVPVTLRETASGVWDWNNGEETEVDLAPDTNLPTPWVVPTPSGLALSNVGILQEDGTVIPKLQVVWTPSANAYVRSGGNVLVEFRVHGTSDWRQWSLLRGDLGLEVIAEVEVGERYDVRVAFQNSLLVRGAYADSLTDYASGFLVVGDTDAPDAPTGLSVEAGTGRAISLSWDANAEVDRNEYGVYRNTVNDPLTATKIAEVSATRFVDISVLLNTTYYYWITAIDASENESSMSTGDSATTDDIDDDISAAAAAAAAAQADADAANAALANIASDNLLTPDEKPRVIQDVAVISAEEAGIDANATTLAITTEKTAYDSAVTALMIYLGSLTSPVDWDDLGGNTTIVGADFRDAFADVYTTRQALLDKIAIKSNPNAPSDPSAPTFNSDGNYASGDGTSLARIVANVPAMPSGAAFLNVLYRRNGVAGWIVADQRSSGGGTTSIDDLSPGTSYEIAAQAFSADGVGSSIVTATGSPFTAPTASSGASNPTGFSVHAPTASYPVAARYSGLGEQFYASILEYTPTTDKTAAYVEFGLSSSTSSAPSGAAYGAAAVKDTQFVFHNIAPFFNLYVWVRTYDRSGVAGAWTYTGINLYGNFGYPAGTISSQDADDVSVSSLQTGNGASGATKVRTLFDESYIATLSGGSPTETFSVSLTGKGFSFPPDSGVGSLATGPVGSPYVVIDFDYDNVSNSSTAAYFIVRTPDGSNITAGNYRFSLKISEIS